MNRKELESYIHKKQELLSLDAMLQELDTALYSPKTARTDGQPRGQGYDEDKRRAGQVTKKERVRAMYERKQARLAEELLRVEQAIEVQEPRERTLLRLHYIQGLTLREISERMHYSRRQVDRIHAAALAKLEKSKR